MGSPLALVFLRQLYYTGVQSAGIVLLLAALVGGGFVLTFEATLPLSAGATLQMMAKLMVNVLGVLLTLMVLAARSVAAISTELAIVQVMGERRSLQRLGIKTWRYLELPRIVAPMLAGSILYLYFVFAALLAGALVSQRTFDVWEVVLIVKALRATHILSGMVRTGLFAGIAVALVLRFPIRNARRFPDVPLAASNGVLWAMGVMLLLELLWQVLLAPLVLSEAWEW